MLEQVEPEEHLLISSYRQICNKIASPKLVYKNTEEVYDHFVQCDNENLPPHVVVSAACDFSIREQEEHHPNNDLYKYCSFIDWEGYGNVRSKYNAIKIISCRPETCCITDRYSAKTDRFTWWTMPELPQNVLFWYVTNLDVSHPRMRLLPFGLNDDGDGYVRLRQHMGKKKTGILYANFSQNTVERIQLAKWCKRQGWITYRERVPNDLYLAEVAEHKCVLCPDGNGLDCYRTYEAIYLQSVPILSRSTFSHNLRNMGLPFASVSNFACLTPKFTEELYDYEAKQWEFNYAPLTKTYWEKEFRRVTS
jgi:hypothetical protein